jgi:hypothetical protein
MSRNKIKNFPPSECGSARIKFLMVLMILISAANAAINYIPVAYQGETFKQEMQTIVVQGLALPVMGENPVEAMKKKVVRAAREYDLPPAAINVRQVNNVFQAHVRYTKEVSIIPFGIYNYTYEFDHTATPKGFLTKN